MDLFKRDSKSFYISRSGFIPGTIRWKSPSNIALIKYWGKYGVQLPNNPSLSMTLKNSITEMELSYSWRETKGEAIDLTYFFEGKDQPKFAKKIHDFLSSLLDFFPYLMQLKIQLSSKNSFPHSAGIASSASSMSALALCLCSLEQRLFSSFHSTEDFLQNASFLARLGSGSACRSIYGGLSMWGYHPEVDIGHQEYGIPLNHNKFNIHPIFSSYADWILIVDSKEKEVSSRVGHQLMENHPFGEARRKDSFHSFLVLYKALQEGNLDDFIQIVEREALTLHSLMMTSNPSFLLMKPSTLKIIEEIRNFRNKTKIPLCFTLDAGPNVHLLFPEKELEKIESFVKEVLAQSCEGGNWIQDSIGSGPSEF